jgi:aromatic ring-opening dioxygenase catalytic subunit (LigB family)
MSAMTSRRLPTLFIPHGGGPWPFLEPPAGQQSPWMVLDRYLRGLDHAIGVTPRAVLVISGHWLEMRPTVSIAKAPTLIYDYYNFPPHTYRLTYPAPGAPELAQRVRALLEANNIACDEADRGFDHGTFIPFMLIYPHADIPIAQLSLRADMDPAAHIAMGRALACLRDEGVLIVGSGLSYHNLREFFSTRPETVAAALSFDAWLDDAVEQSGAAVRDAKLAQWANAPGARACHPTEEHLLPLMVAAGAALGDTGHRTFHDHIFGKPVSGFQFG